jgi:hypothetical protein
MDASGADRGSEGHSEPRRNRRMLHGQVGYLMREKCRFLDLLCLPLDGQDHLETMLQD